MTSLEKQREEQKRDRMYDPALRWQHIQEMITWAEENMPPHLRRNRPRVHPFQKPTIISAPSNPALHVPTP